MFIRNIQLGIMVRENILRMLDSAMKKKILINSFFIQTKYKNLLKANIHLPLRQIYIYISIFFLLK